MWFEKLTGFKEENPEQVRSNIKIDGNQLISKVNGKGYVFGRLEVPTLAELRLQSPINNDYDAKLKITEVVGNIQSFHIDTSNAGAFFQAASQFNLLEMVSPSITPEAGIGIYENDFTQGPACAIACGAGTIYRNYFAPVNGQIGQTANHQIDCLQDLGVELGNDRYHLWQMSNGYALVNRAGLKNISNQIQEKSPREYEELKGKLRIGIQWDTEVTISEDKHLVTQAYCSALPVAYTPVDSSDWVDFAKLILEATYEATFHAALINYKKTGNNKVYLTLVGGGVFGNKMEWILDAIKKTMDQFMHTPLDVKIVSYGHSNTAVATFIRQNS